VELSAVESIIIYKNLAVGITVLKESLAYMVGANTYKVGILISL
jgi:hypothetical protein